MVNIEVPVSFNDFVNLVNDCIARFHPRQYKTTLAFTKENLERAYQVYILGITEGLTLIQAVTKVKGYRYRRLEDFVRSLGIYQSARGRNTGGWVVSKNIIKIDVTYRAKSSNKNLRIIVEAELNTIEISEESAKVVTQELIDYASTYYEVTETEVGFELRFAPLIVKKQNGKVYVDVISGNYTLLSRQEDVDIQLYEVVEHD